MLTGCSPCSKCGKEFLYDVGSGELGSDILQCILLNVFNFKLFNLSGLGTMCLQNFTRTKVAKEYIERGEHDHSICALVSAA